MPFKAFINSLNTITGDSSPSAGLQTPEARAQGQAAVPGGGAAQGQAGEAAQLQEEVSIVTIHNTWSRYDVARSASECCLHSAPAPLCAGESNVTLALETRWVIISIQGHPQSLYRVIHNNLIFSLQVQRAAQHKRGCHGQHPVGAGGGAEWAGSAR